MTSEALQSNKSMPEHYSYPIISKVIGFLNMFMPMTVAKRIVCIILLSIGVTVEEVARISGFCEKTVKSINKKVKSNEIDVLFVIGGGGRKGSLSDIEKDIIEDVNQNIYHSRQQIADMIYEKYGLKVSPKTVGKLLKKTGLSV